MSIPAIIGIMCFSMSFLTQANADHYFQFPMGIIGKVYTNSMLALINSRMLLVLGSEESTITSSLKFATVPANNKYSAIHGNLALDTKVLAGSLRGSHPWQGI